MTGEQTARAETGLTNTSRGFPMPDKNAVAATTAPNRQAKQRALVSPQSTFDSTTVSRGSQTNRVLSPMLFTARRLGLRPVLREIGMLWAGWCNGGRDAV